MSHDILKKRKIQANITRKNCSRNTVHSRIQSLFQPRYLDHFCLLALFFTTYFFARQNKSTIVYAILRVQTLLFTVFTTLNSVPVSSGLVWRSFWNLIQFDLEKISFFGFSFSVYYFSFWPKPRFQTKVFKITYWLFKNSLIWKSFALLSISFLKLWTKTGTSKNKYNTINLVV